MPAVLTFAFDPLLHVGDVTVRTETVVLGAVILAGLLLAVAIGRKTPIGGPYVPPPTLRPIDLPFLILGIVPGAVAGGRLDHVLVHADYYVANPGAILDPTRGALGLGLAIPGAILGGIVIARLVDAPVGPWLHAATLPLLFVLAGGKLSGALAADGQGQPSTLPWATAYLGDGPWGSLAAWLPSHPSQVYEALATTVVLMVLGLALRAGAFTRRDGTALFAAVAAWAAGRGLVAATWRDALVLGPLRAEQLVMAGVVGACLAAIVAVRRVPRG